jgi:hypothetical protein
MHWPNKTDEIQTIAMLVASACVAVVIIRTLVAYEKQQEKDYD